MILQGLSTGLVAGVKAWVSSTRAPPRVLARGLGIHTPLRAEPVQDVRRPNSVRAAPALGLGGDVRTPVFRRQRSRDRTAARRAYRRRREQSRRETG